jgi:hypothetical protein
MFMKRSALAALEQDFQRLQMGGGAWELVRYAPGSVRLPCLKSHAMLRLELSHAHSLMAVYHWPYFHCVGGGVLCFAVA